jgi:hypothetical protein
MDAAPKGKNPIQLGPQESMLNPLAERVDDERHADERGPGRHVKSATHNGPACSG